MSNTLEVVADNNQLKDNRFTSKLFNNNDHKRKIRSKENYFKPKCNKQLKKKLKKYKLRRDGNDDPEVLDVSQILVTALKIKSPNNSDKISESNIQDQKPRNYLFKMVRRRKVCAQFESTKNLNDNILQNGNCDKTILSDEACQVNKQNAFKMMMDSRNKSIGTNSPGKELIIDESVEQEIIEKKAVKTKRILSLQKMAESKGSLKNKEIEDYREKCIKKKMLKRAELFKEMITKQDTKVETRKPQKSKKVEVVDKLKTNTIEKLENSVQRKKTLKLCDMFNGTDVIIQEETQQAPLDRVSDEDIEFLKKLSPSIRKKENMLCYFKKVTKENELILEQSEMNLDSTSVIKVKFTPKRKKKIKTLKSINEVDDLTASNNVESNIDVCNENRGDVNISPENCESRKRKRNKIVEKNISTKPTELQDDIEPMNNENRPKRNVKKPVKYSEDVNCFSSDEELHIFTPKKKRNSDKSLKAKTNNSSDCEPMNMPILEEKKTVLPNQLLSCNDKDKSKIKRSLKNDTIVVKKKIVLVKTENEKKPVKLAPIFVGKSQLSQEAFEAKQKFLKSGVPEKLKKKVQKPNSITTLDNFYSVIHIQQNSSHINYKGTDWLKINNVSEEIYSDMYNYSFKSLLAKSSTEMFELPFQNYKPEKVLKCIKTLYPKFPVYRTYHRLRGKSKGDFKDINYTDLDNSIEIIDGCTEVNSDNPEKLNWCDKYKSTSSRHIIGNFESIKELKRWLETWSEKLIKAKNSDTSDMSDFYSSDMDSRDSLRTTNSVLILTGKTGSGKTSSVYAIAAELAIKVIEVNASSKRNGKIMLQDLQEATQSHKVDRAKTGSESSQRSQEKSLVTYTKKRGRPKRAQELIKPKIKQLTETSSQLSSSQESLRMDMSLILIDDADVVFEQDDGFCSAVTQLIHCSKRPVILVTSSLSCPHLQKFIQNGKILHMRPLLPRMLGTWLDIMCLADVGKCCMGFGEKLLDHFKGDIRKTINCLQFYMNSFRNGNQAEDEIISQVKSNIDDESSSMSWADTENLDSLVPIEKNPYGTAKQLQLFLNHNPNIFETWWSLNTSYNNINSQENEKENENDKLILKNDEFKKINKLAEILDVFTTIDYIDHLNPDKKANIMSKPWYCSENASLLETEDMDEYNRSHFLSKEISNELLNLTISEAHKILKIDITTNTPTMCHYRERDRLVSRHNTLSSYLNPSAVLDRRATALDYWSSCRTICRLEKSKTDCNLKRNNRFCHYLKSLNILCKNDFFDNLADSFI